MPSWWDWNAVAALGQWAGAIATTVAVIVALSAERRARRTFLTVNVTSGPLDGRKKGSAFIISAVNQSGRTVKLERAAIFLADGRLLGPIVTDKFIGDITDLEKRTYQQPQEEVAAWLINLGIVVETELIFKVEDTTGKQHSCKYRFNPGPFQTR